MLSSLKLRMMLPAVAVAIAVPASVTMTVDGGRPEVQVISNDACANEEEEGGCFYKQSKTCGRLRDHEKVPN